MAPRSPISQTFHDMAESMRREFERSGEALTHRGLRGHAREGLLINEFLSKYLPRTVLVRRNTQIISSTDEMSPECDIVICDPATPPMWTFGDIDVVPIECVHVVIEVKSRLDGPELRKAWQSLGRIKRFPKRAFITRPDDGRPSVVPFVVAYGREWDYFPTHAYVFAFESVTLDTLAAVMGELAESTPLAERIDGVWTLDRGSLLWRHPETGSFEPERDRPIQMQVIETGRSESPLPLMAMQLQALVQQALMPSFNIGSYMSGVSFGVGRPFTWIE